MKLFRFGEPGREKPGVMLSDAQWIDVSSFIPDYNEEFFASGATLRLREWLVGHQNDCPVVDPGVRLGSCVARPSKIIGIGLNYAKHASESGHSIPKEPIVFLKATSALCGPNDDIVIPKNATKADYEVELGVVIGRRANYVSEQDAMNYVAGYCVANDVSERELQARPSGQISAGKSCDTFAPIGPFLATRDEITDPQNLRLWLSVNGEMRQDSNTADMIFKVSFLVSHVSHFMSLLPGDVIMTGTPSGVGYGFKPPRYLKPDDVLELGIDNLGVARQRMVAYAAR